MNFTEVPLMVRDRWFTEFKRTYTWRLEFDAKARREFDKKAGDRLRGTLNQVFKMALHKQVSFMTDTVRAEFINKRKHPDFVKRSNQARDNRLSGQTLEKFDPGHRQGSISTPQVVKKMGEYMEKLEEYKNKGIEINPDKVYLEVVGGQKKGKVYSLGSASHMYYKSDPTSQSTASSSTPSMISQLSSQVEELKKMAEENHNKVEESQKIAAESLKCAEEFVENHEIEKATWKKEKLAMQKTLQEMASLVKQVYRPYKPPTPAVTRSRDTTK
ncbi:uncharacterized protein LOC110700020 isoform X2 [Chenopodium quinoa]|nr:uncharacterized protein LOC110700020 isoform X2 [Chenopodium quinoa]